MSKKINIAIFGVSGYTGAEMLRLTHNHAYINIKYIAGAKTAGMLLSEVYSEFIGTEIGETKIIAINDVNYDILDCIFLCLPHGTSHKIADQIPDNIKIIDLSADFRINDMEIYEKWYGKHNNAALQQKFIYGLTEIYSNEIKNANYVACPGCYPTSILLPLIPLLKHKLIDSNIIADSKSGMSGAGRGEKQANLFVEINENLRPYSVSGHRHMAEILEQLNKFSSEDVNLIFTPQVIPIDRGILSNIYVNSEKSLPELKNSMIEFYKEHKYVNIYQDDKIPELKDVAKTNFININILPTYVENKYIIISVLDNLMKGASGQAMQNFELMFNSHST